MRYLSVGGQTIGEVCGITLSVDNTYRVAFARHDYPAPLNEGAGQRVRVSWCTPVKDALSGNYFLSQGCELDRLALSMQFTELSDEVTLAEFKLLPDTFDVNSLSVGFTLS